MRSTSTSRTRPREPAAAAVVALLLPLLVVRATRLLAAVGDANTLYRWRSRGWLSCSVGIWRTRPGCSLLALRG